MKFVDELLSYWLESGGIPRSQEIRETENGLIGGKLLRPQDIRTGNIRILGTKLFFTMTGVPTFYNSKVEAGWILLRAQQVCSQLVVCFHKNDLRSFD